MSEYEVKETTGELPVETVEKLVCGFLVHDPDIPDFHEFEKGNLEEISKAGVTPGWFSDEGTGEIFGELFAECRRVGRCISVEEYDDALRAAGMPKEKSFQKRATLGGYWAAVLLRKARYVAPLVAIMKRRAPATAALPAKFAPIVPCSPTDEELALLCKGTPYEVLIAETNNVAKDVPPIHAITGTAVLIGAYLAGRLRIGDASTDPSLKPATNVYGLLSGPPASGKGLTGKCVEQAQMLMEIPHASEGSEMIFIQNLAEMPWSITHIRELQPYLARSWHADVVPRLVDSFDSDIVSMSTKKSGKMWVYGSKPSLLAQCQPHIWAALRTKDLESNGFVSRFLISHDPRPEPAEDVIGTIARRAVDYQPVARALLGFLEWAGPAGRVGGEGIGSDKGCFKHGIPTRSLEPEKYDSILATHRISGRMRPNAMRLIAHYLPILAIPFSRKGDLARGVIPGYAMERADRLLLAYYWGALKLLRITPVDDEDAPVRRLVATLENRGAMTKRDLRRTGSFGRHPKDFEDALQCAIDQGLVMAAERKVRGETSVMLSAVPRDDHHRPLGLALTPMPADEPAPKPPLVPEEELF